MQKFLPCKIRLGWHRYALFAIYFLPLATKSNKIEPWEWKLLKEAQWTIVDPRSDSNLEPYYQNPPVPKLDRQCNLSKTLENNVGTRVEIETGDGVFFPVTCIHFNSKFYPEP